jgi:hypothetical protein
MPYDELSDLEVDYAQLIVDTLELPNECVDLAMRYALTGLTRDALEHLRKCRDEHPQHQAGGDV